MNNVEVVELSDDEAPVTGTTKAHVEVSVLEPIDLALLLQRGGTGVNLARAQSALVRPPYQLPVAVHKNGAVPIKRPLPNGNIPSHIKLPDRVDKARLDRYKLVATGRYDRGYEVDGITFKCTYMDCNKLIYGNGHMICHLWAHFNEATPFERLSRPLSHHRMLAKRGLADVETLTRCTQCRHAFKSPYDLQCHYTRTHSRVPESTNESNCAICETEQMDLRGHLSQHRINDSPYVCKVRSCEFRASQRMNLFDHYSQMHRDTTLLWCPFCPYVEYISRSQLRTSKDAIHCRSLIDHFMKHVQVGQTYRCRLCAYAFLTRTELHAHQHADHTGVIPPSWNVKATKNAWQTSTSSKLQIHPEQKKLKNKCVICQCPCEQTKCSFCQQNSREFFKKGIPHEFERDGLNKKKIGRVQLKCGCNFTTYNSDLMTHHRGSCKHTKAVVSVELPPRPDDDQQPSEADFREAKLFGVLPRENCVRRATYQSTRNGEAMKRRKLADIREVITDIDDDHLLVTKQALVRARHNDVAASLAIYRKIFGT